MTCLLVLASLVATAKATTIKTELCDSTSGPALSISAPLSDSVVGTAQVHLQGTALRTTQIDISLNGAYSSSLAIEPSGQIDTVLTLFAGTNTILLQAYYSCNQTASTESIVVTYEPAATPSTGSTTTTAVPLTPSPAPSGNKDKDTPTVAETPHASGNNARDPDPLMESPDKTEEPRLLVKDELDWLPLALIATTLATPTLVLWGAQQLHGAIGAASRQLPATRKRSIRASGIIAAALLAALLYGVLSHV